MDISWFFFQITVFTVLQIMPEWICIISTQQMLLLLLLLLLVFLCVWRCGGGIQHVFRLPKLSSLDFRSVRLANWKLPLKRGSCELDLSNLRAWELKFWLILMHLKLKSPIFLRGACDWLLSSVAWNGTLAKLERCEKESSGPHLPIPHS